MYNFQQAARILENVSTWKAYNTSELPRLCLYVRFFIMVKSCMYKRYEFYCLQEFVFISKL